MAKLGDMLVAVGADFSGFDRAMGTMSQRLSAVDRDARKAFSGFDAIGARLQGFGTVATAAITLPLAAGGFAVTKMAADFDQGMRKVSSLIDNVTEKDFKNLSAQVLQLSRDLGVDAVNATGALYQALSTGIPKENAVDFLRISSVAAIAGMTDTKVAVDGITTVLQAYNLDAKETRAVSDAMFAAVKVGKLEFPELAASIGTAAGTAKLLGVSYQELLAAGATLTNTTGQKIPEAMTMLQSAFKSLVEPSKEMSALMGKVGFESGVAMTKTLGLEVALQELWKASGKNVEVFQKAFGRMEGFRAAVGLTGTNAAKAAEQLEYLGHASDGVGQAQMAANEINKSTTRQWEIALAAIKATAIEMGAALLPAVNQLLQASKPLIDMLKGAVDWFTKLSPGIQTTIIAVTAAVAAVGPLAFAFGTLISAIASVGTAFLSMGGVVTAATGTMGASVAGLSGVFTALIPIVAAVGAAFVAWSLLTDAKDRVSDLSQSLSDIIAPIDRFHVKMSDGKATTTALSTEMSIAVGWVGTLMKAMDAASKVDWWERIKETLGPLGLFNGLLRQSTEALEGLKKLLGIYPDMDKLVVKSAAAQHEFAKAYDISGGAMELARLAAMKVTKAVGDQNKVIFDSEKQHKSLQDAVTKLQSAYDGVARAFLAGKASTEQLEAAQIKLRKAQDALNPQQVLERSAKAWEEASDRIDKDIKDTIAAYEKLNEASRDLEKSTTDLALTFGKAHEEMRKEGQKEIKVTATLDARLPEQITEVIAQNKVFKEDLKTLGIEHVRHADAAVAAYERIKNSGKATATELLRAEKAMLEAVITERRANGEAVSKEDIKRLEELEKRLNIHKGVWADFSKQVSTIMSDLGKDITKSIFGLFRGNKENEKLDQEAAALRKSLVERAQDWEDYKLSVEEKMVSLREKNAAGLAEQVADLNAALAEKRADYEEYVTDVGQQLEDLRNKHGEAESQEVQELASRLRERESEYEDYVRTVEEKVQDIRSSHASALEGELEDLRENLRERAEDYADYVSDVGTKLSRLRADSADALGDRGTDTGRRIADKKKEFKRDEEDINTKIQRLLKAGKKANDTEIQDLQKALQRKRQDLDEYVKEQQEDLVDFTAEHKRKLAEQEADLKLSLERKTRDEKQAQTEIEERMSGAVLKHRTAEEEQLKDLRASLAAKATDLSAFQLATQEKIAAVTIKHAEAVAKEEAELVASLAKRTAEWQKYQDGVALKIDDLNAKAAAQLGAEEAALKAGLDEKLAAWEAYKSEVAAKLIELKDAHQTFADQIKTALQGSLDAMGQAIVRFGVEFLEGKLFKWLGDLVTTILPSVGTALAGVFGGIGGAAAGGLASAAGGIGGATAGQLDKIGGIAGSLGGAGGSAAGAAGQAAGMGVSAMVGMATGAISAVSDVIGNFQFMAMNKSLDLIEKSTRFSEIHLFHSLGKFNDFLPKLKDIYDYLWLTQITALNNFTAIMEDNLALRLVEIRDSVRALPMTPAMAGGGAPSIVIQNNTFRDRDDIDYVIEKIGIRLRETGNTI